MAKEAQTLLRPLISEMAVSCIMAWQGINLAAPVGIVVLENAVSCIMAWQCINLAAPVGTLTTTVQTPQSLASWETAVLSNVQVKKRQTWVLGGIGDRGLPELSKQ